MHGLTDLGAVAKRSVSFRNFPKLSVSFRFVPFCSGWFRTDPLLPGAWCRDGSAECGVRSAEKRVRRAECRVHGEKQGRHCATRTYGFQGGCQTFRNVPLLSETFRFVPFRSVLFGMVPGCSGSSPAFRGPQSRCIGILTLAQDRAYRLRTSSDLSTPSAAMARSMSRRNRWPSA